MAAEFHLLAGTSSGTASTDIFGTARNDKIWADGSKVQVNWPPVSTGHLGIVMEAQACA